MSKVIIVTGATGQQGGATIDNLLDSNFTILALTRNPSSGSALKLAKKSENIKIIQGDLENPAGVFLSAKVVTKEPIWGVFCVLAFNDKTEVRQGTGFIDEALKNDVKYFVYSSADRGGEKSLEPNEQFPHREIKSKIERHLMEVTKGSEMQWAIIRPTFFMSLVSPGLYGRSALTALKIYLSETPIQMIDVKDIGFFVADALKNPGRYVGKCLSIAGDNLNFKTIDKVFKEKTGSPAPVIPQSIMKIYFRWDREAAGFFDYFVKEGYGADIEQCRKMHPGLNDFASFVERNKAGYS